MRKPLDMHPMDIVEEIDKLQERLRVVPGDNPMSIEAHKNATLFFNIMLQSTFASKCVEENNGETDKGKHRTNSTLTMYTLCLD